jgi:hypothetical protein
MAVTPCASSGDSEHGRYAHLIRQQLREQLISGYLPVAEHIARRFASRTVNSR